MLCHTTALFGNLTMIHPYCKKKEKKKNLPWVKAGRCVVYVVVADIMATIL